MPTPAPSAKALFDEAVELPSAAERQAYLDQACAGALDVRLKVEALLRAYEEAGSFLERPAVTGPVATVDEAPLREGPGTVIGSYKLLEPIGEGGFGIVFLAEQMHPVRRKVALKVLKPGMDTRQVVARFEAERQALALMDHPHIAHVFDGGETASGRPYFVMELVKGVPITAFCDQGRLGVRQRLELFVSVFQAVQHAHHKGIIHRDLKPSNVLVSLQDQTPVVKVIDFGIAKATGQRLTDKSVHTGWAQLIGTPLYMSPEQAGLSGLDVDTRSDIYSLGVLLYELLTGTTPFDKEQLSQVGYDELCRIIREEEPPKPSTRLSMLGQAATAVATQRQSDPKQLSRLFRGELDWIVMKALEKDRSRRYETASAFAQDVQRYLQDQPVLACPPSAWYRCRKLARRNKAGLAMVGLVLVFLVFLGSGIGWIVRDQAARQAEVIRQVQDLLGVARELVGANQVAAARQKLAEARSRIGTDRDLVGDVADDIESLDAALARFERFLGLDEQAHDAEFPQPALLAQDNGAGRTAAGPQWASPSGRDPGKAVPYLLEALSCYGILEQDDWSAQLEGGLLAPQQVARLRRTAYEQLLWLAHDGLGRKVNHRSGKPLEPKEAAQEALAYLRKAEPACAPTSAFYHIRGQCRQALGDTDAAGQDQERARHLPGTLALDHYLLALTAYGAGDKAEAVRQCNAALRLEPTDYWSLMWLAISLSHLNGQREDDTAAVAAFTGCILRRPGHAQAYSARGHAYLKLGLLDDGMVDYREALRLQPDFPSAHNNLAYALAGQGKYVEAEKACREAIRLRPDSPEAHNNLGFALEKQGKPDAAEKEHREALRLRSDFPTAHNNLGVALVRQGKYAAAEKEYREAIRLRPDFPEAHNNLGHVLNRRRKHTEAEKECREAIRLRPAFSEAHCHLGYALAGQGKHVAAEKEYREAIRLRPNFPEAHVGLGSALHHQGKLAAAEKEYCEAIRLLPGLPEAHSNLGSALYEQGKLAAAEKEHREAIRLRPDLPEAHVGLGHVLNEQGKPAAAEKEHREALRLRPDDPKALVGLGIALNDQRKPAAAEKECRKAIRLHRDYPLAHAVLGMALHLQGKLAEAVVAYREAIRLKPDDPDEHNNLGVVLADQGKHAEAEKEYREAIRLRPNNPAAYFNLGMALNAQGKQAAAVAQLCEALRLQPSFQLAQQCLPPLLWRLAAFPEPQSSNPRQTTALAQQAAALLPQDPTIRLALSVAHYRAASWQAALQSMEQALPLRNGGDPCDWCLLAMIHWRLGKKEKARQWYDRAVAWMEHHHDAKWDAFRAEAATLLDLPRLVPFRNIPYMVSEAPFTINVLGLAFTPDSRRVLATGDGNDLRLFEVESGKEVRRFTGHTHWVGALALSVDGRLALSGGHDKTLRLWNMDTGKEVRQLLGHSTPVRFVAFSPDGKHALSGGHQDHVLRLWDVQSGTVTRRLTGHTGEILHAVLSPDGREVLSAGADKTIRVWKVASGDEVRQFEKPPATSFIGVSPDGKKALSVGPEDSAPRLWDVASGKRLPGLEGSGNKKDPPHEAAFTSDGRLAVSLHDRKVRLWDVTIGKELYCVELDGLHPNHVAISRDGCFVATANWRGWVTVWKLIDPRPVRQDEPKNSDR